MYVKSTGILGGQGKMPTVVSPEVYRQRFCDAMQSYFLMIPNKWMGLGNEQKWLCKDYEMTETPDCCQLMLWNVNLFLYSGETYIFTHIRAVYL